MGEGIPARTRFIQLAGMRIKTSQQKVPEKASWHGIIRDFGSNVLGTQNSSAKLLETRKPQRKQSGGH